MTEPKTIALAYIETWNQTASEKRSGLLDRHWTDDASYVDPLMAGKGKEQIGGLIAAVQERFPDFTFALRGVPDGHGEHVRLSWSFGPSGLDAPIEGTDFVQVVDGKIQRVIGFIDRAPAA